MIRNVFILEKRKMPFIERLLKKKKKTSKRE